MNPIANALSMAIVEILSAGDPVTIEGLGTFNVRRYPDFGAGKVDALPYFIAAPALRKAIEAGAAPSGFTAPLLLDRLSVITKLPHHDAAKALDAFLSELVRRVVEEPERRVPFGRLGLVRVHTKTARTREPDAPSRKVFSFVASGWLRDRINGRSERATAPSANVSSTLAAFSTALATADQVLRAAELAGAMRGGASEQTLQRIEHETGASLPALLRTVLAGYDVRSLVKTLPIELLSPEEYPTVLADHRRLMTAAKEKPGVPFAREASGDVWCYCLEHGPEVWVFDAGPDEGAMHTHSMTLSAWVGGSLLVAALRRALGDSLLAMDDVQAVLARLYAIAPNADFAVTELPF